ncbi:MAG: hypothetical protein ACI8YQ_004120 [Polaribacter sp.]|jgi:hypothetical protein
MTWHSFLSKLSIPKECRINQNLSNYEKLTFQIGNKSESYFLCNY